MDLRKILRDKGVEGLADELQPLVDQLEELTKPVATPPVVPDVAEEEGESENG